jgi:hypothetical protein
VVVITSSLGKNTESLHSVEVFLMSETHSPKVLKQFFENTEKELWLSFAHSQASLLHEKIKVISTSCQNYVVKAT